MHRRNVNKISFLLTKDEDIKYQYSNIDTEKRVL